MAPQTIWNHFPFESKYNNNCDLTITNVYIPPKINIDKEIIRKSMSGKNHLICGDLNAKNSTWGSPMNDARGDVIGELLDELNLTVLNTGAGTRINYDGSLSHLDVAFASNNISHKMNWEIKDECWGSDHLPSEITFNETPSVEQQIAPKFKFKKADWSKFKSMCREINDDVLNPSVDITTENITEAIITIAESCIPKLKTRTKKMVPFWNENCKRAVQNKRRTKQKMDNTKEINDCIKYRKAKAEMSTGHSSKSKNALARILWIHK